MTDEAPDTITDESPTYDGVLDQLHQLPEDHPGKLLKPYVENLIEPRAAVAADAVSEGFTEDPLYLSGPDEVDTTSAFSSPDRVEISEMPTVPLRTIQTEYEDADTNANLSEGYQYRPPNFSDVLEHVKRVNRQEMDESSELTEYNFNVPVSTHLVLPEGSYTPDQLIELVTETRRMCERHAEWAQHHKAMFNDSYDQIFLMLGYVPDQLLQETYRNESLSVELQQIVAKSEDSHLLRGALRVLEKVYWAPDVLALYEPDSPAATDPLMQTIRKNENHGMAVAEEINRFPPSYNVAKDIKETRDWSIRYLELVAGLPKDQAQELMFAAHSLTTNPQTGHPNLYGLGNMLENVYAKCQTFSTAELLQLRQEAGIVNLGNYTSEQLRLMSNFLNGDPEAIKHLQAGDTTVVLKDAKGDYNGALTDVSEEFGSASNRTLFFEVNQPSDLYRHLLRLKHSDVKPSTIILAAHGEPGLMHFNQELSHFQIDNKESMPFDPNKTMGYHAGAAHGIHRVVRDIMQDSRGIDDNEEAIGRRRIVVASCSSAAPIDVMHVTAHKGMRRFLDHNLWGAIPYEITTKSESTSETITNMAGQANLDVYGTDRPFGMRKTPLGIVAVDFIKNEFGPTLIEEPISSTRFRLDNRGNIIEDKVTEVVLRNQNARNQGEQG